MLAFSVAGAVALLVLYLEVKNLQEKINSTRSIKSCKRAGATDIKATAKRRISVCVQS